MTLPLESSASIPKSLPATGRWFAIDAARAVAVLAMIVYHFTWDLSFYRLIDLNPAVDPRWRTFALSIAGSFLMLVGFGLVLAHGRGFRASAFWRRFALIAGAAALVTLGTWFAFPDAMIWFGILHCIALSSVLAIPFLRAPFWLTFIAAALCLAAPHYLSHPFFDAPGWLWLGLRTHFPHANDYVPILPWFGMTLIGVGLGRLTIARFTGAAWTHWQPEGSVAKILGWIGRHSLPIYLLHQPLLLGALYPIAELSRPAIKAEDAPFFQQCQRSCVQSGGGAKLCTSFCDCMIGELKTEGLWKSALSGRFDATEQSKVDALTKRCLPAPRDDSDAKPPNG